MGTVVLIMLLAWMVGIAVMILVSRSEGGDFPQSRQAHTTSTPINTRNPVGPIGPYGPIGAINPISAPLNGLDGAFSPVASIPPGDTDASASFR